MSGELKIKWCKKTAQIYQATDDPFVDKFITCHDFKNINNSKIEKELNKLLKNLLKKNNEKEGSNIIDDEIPSIGGGVGSSGSIGCPDGWINYGNTGKKLNFCLMNKKGHGRFNYKNSPYRCTRFSKSRKYRGVSVQPCSEIIRLEDLQCPCGWSKFDGAFCSDGQFRQFKYNSNRYHRCYLNSPFKKRIRQTYKTPCSNITENSSEYNIYGTRNDNGTCDCYEGYGGDNCQYSEICNYNGWNKDDGTCYCQEGYAGDKCEYSEICNYNGSIQDDETCVCKEGYVGDQCQYSREDTCNNKGNPNNDGTCECDDGYAGDNCQYTREENCIEKARNASTNNIYTMNKCDIGKTDKSKYAICTTIKMDAREKCNFNGVWISSANRCECHRGDNDNNCEIDEELYKEGEDNGKSYTFGIRTHTGFKCNDEGYPVESITSKEDCKNYLTRDQYLVNIGYTAWDSYNSLCYKYTAPSQNLEDYTTLTPNIGQCYGTYKSNNYSMGTLTQHPYFTIFEYMPNNIPYEKTYCWIGDEIKLKNESNSTVEW